jgi:hypothetical protein
MASPSLWDEDWVCCLKLFDTLTGKEEDGRSRAGGGGVEGDCEEDGGWDVEVARVNEEFDDEA